MELAEVIEILWRNCHPIFRLQIANELENFSFTQTQLISRLDLDIFIIKTNFLVQCKDRQLNMIIRKNRNTMSIFARKRCNQEKTLSEELIIFRFLSFPNWIEKDLKIIWNSLDLSYPQPLLIAGAVQVTGRSTVFLKT